ncbi:hypothetical protein [Mucilaginibacter aquariorum]|uniref:Uncharacterized protein n=1 Tax=Mucilaginibacter aquariorum TaxID=2967225 RepID=A0ABT1SVY6_9SPHI|nr:hypothetical protein [Mucilaginibacter aquariorum]MCQ6956368.1 hypothetical protein [Mucilaginibacter aquariorum]
MRIAFMRKYLFLPAVFCILAMTARAQTVEQIVAEIGAVNSKVVNATCATGTGMLISNKAMNIFLSNKVSSYLSDNYDLSLYKNYVTLNAAEGSIAISHNFHQPVDTDDRVRSFWVISARANIANTYAGNFTGRYINNQLGVALQKTWMGKPKTLYDCADQKLKMDADRAILIQNIATGVRTKATAFETDLTALKSNDVPGQDLTTVKNTLRRNFYATLREEYLRNFSQAQSDLLINTNNYKWITDAWTTVGIYAPVIPQKFEVADGNNNAASRYNYPFQAFVMHTRFWDSPKTGRFFLVFLGKASINNSVQGGDPGLTGSDGSYAGTYRNYLTPSVSGKLVYILPDSHVGVSFKSEKNFGSYHAANLITGIPIVLIDKKGVPIFNFEPQIIFYNINNTPLRNELSRNKIFVGLTVGFPLSKIVY